MIVLRSSFPSLTLQFLLWSSLSCFTSSEIFSISDRNYPHLFINEPTTAPLVWHKKSLGFRLANTAAVRINAR